MILSLSVMVCVSLLRALKRSLGAFGCGGDGVVPRRMHAAGGFSRDWLRVPLWRINGGWASVCVWCAGGAHLRLEVRRAEEGYFFLRGGSYVFIF